MRDATRRRNNAIVDVWNMGVNTLAELGVAYKLPRNSIGRILTEARKAGQAVLDIGLADRCARMSRGQQRRLGNAGTGPILGPPQIDPVPLPATADGGQTSKAAPNPTI